LVGLEPELLERNVKELGDAHMWVEADVTDQSALDAAVSATAERLGGIDVVMANAGIATFGTIRTADPEAFARTVSVNLVGVYRTMAAAVPHLVDSRGYALIVASLASFVPMPGGAAYAASKAGVDSLAASLRMELVQYGVDVGSVHPSWIDTDLVRVGEEALPTFRRMRSELPPPANKTTTVEECATAMADAIERRALRVFVPGNGRVVSLMRSLTMAAPLARLARRRLAENLTQLDKENQAQGATWR
jgi:NAD(P)-dependent dehydrogenase (short-subunit alcohol dehydrogenase family)